MQAEASSQALERLRAVGKLGEESKLDGGEQRFGGPEREPGLHDEVGSERSRHGVGSPVHEMNVSSVRIMGALGLINASEPMSGTLIPRPLTVDVPRKDPVHARS